MPTSRRAPSGRASALGLLISTMVAALLTTLPAAPAGAVDSVVGTGHAREVRAERALGQARALFRGAAPSLDATMTLRRLVLLRDALPADDRAEADRILARPTDGDADPGGTGYAPGTTPRVLCDVICVHWVDTSADAVDQTDTTPANGIPDYVETVAAIGGGVHQTYVDAGYRAPLADGSLGGDGRTDVYLANIGPQGLYGYCTSDQDVPNQGPYDAWAYCVLDNDYASDEFPTNTPVENLEVTLAHEYFHAVQFAYDIAEDGWFMEATATWAEDELFDDVDDNVQYLPSGPGANPRVPLDLFSGSHQYGDWIFFRYLTERFPAAEGGLPTLVRQMWERADGATGGPDEYSIQAVAGALADRGLTFSTVFAQFADANRTPGSSYSEGSANHYPAAPAWKKATLARGASTGWASVSLDHLSSATARFTPGSGLRKQSSRLKLLLDMAPTARGSVALVSVYRTSGGASSYLVGLTSGGQGQASFPFSSRKIRAVEVTLVNASRRYRCWMGTEVSCSGQARDDGLTERVRAVVAR